MAAAAVAPGGRLARPLARGSARLTFLGTGTSEGVPRVSCLTRPDAEAACPVCWSARHVPGSPNRRRNTGALVEVPAEGGGRHRTVAIDCGKMWWESAVAAFPCCGLRRIDAMMLTHWHADAMLGLDDLRDFTANMKDPDDGFEGLTIHCNEVTLEQHVKRVFPYLVKTLEEVRAMKATGGGVAEISFGTFVDGTSFEPVPGLVVTPFNVEHGGCKEMTVFRMGSLVYISDISGFPPGSRRFLQGAKHVVLDALQPDGTHPSHFTLEQAVEEVKGGFGIGLAPEEVWLVGMNHRVDHDQTNALLRSAGLCCPMACAADGQQLEFSIYDHRAEIGEPLPGGPA